MSPSNAAEAFQNAVRHHFSNPPGTWEVVRLGDRKWGIGPAGADHAYDHYPTQREATAALSDGTHPYRRIWAKDDAWYRGVAAPGHYRSLTPAERAFVDNYLADTEAAQGRP